MNSSSRESTRTLRLRLKDKHSAWLREQAREVNFVWNYCNELALKILQREGRFCSSAELDRYTAGATKEGLSLHSQTVQAISKELVTRRRQFKKRRLAWRTSSGVHRSLGWIPVKASALRYKGGQVWYGGSPLSLWDSYGLHQYELGTGSFSEDSRGRWYLNVTVLTKRAPASSAKKAVGLDLGLKDFLATSDGLKVDAHDFYRELEPSIAVAQRANKKQRVRAIHAKIANRRKDALHKLSTALVHEYGAIFVGNVNTVGLAQTRMAKSVLDAGWRAFRTMLQYKCDDAGAWFEAVNEAFSTQTCSCCASRTGPKGVAGLGIRAWRCEVCGSEHDRDINAARNILLTGMASRAAGAGLQDGNASARLAAGRGRLAEGIPVL
ncbi:transposase [Burkholderia ubonensis]|uniref:Transposase n=1 Tax=Burkholderia ubonensis TaxID=101571 RepID=A0A106QCZ5_9BURK|nr:RNA-guided endonuclease TnpB family protein [Burkholderia ubonensis]KWA84018.1 transposase [Burkholderia ubonensis]